MIIKCYTCCEVMKCVDDINQEHLRVDWYNCPRCSSWAEVILDSKDYYVKSVEWHRDKK